MGSSKQYENWHNSLGTQQTINIHNQISSSTNSARGFENELAINEFLQKLLKEINDRDVEAIQKHLETIKSVLKNEIEDFDRILFAGSVAKNTFINGTSDIDALVFLNREKYKTNTPKELKEQLYEMLKKRFPSTEIKKEI